MRPDFLLFRIAITMATIETVILARLFIISNMQLTFLSLPIVLRGGSWVNPAAAIPTALLHTQLPKENLTGFLRQIARLRGNQMQGK